MCTLNQEMQHETRAIATSSLPVKPVMKDYSGRMTGQVVPQTKHTDAAIPRSSKN